MVQRRAKVALCGLLSAGIVTATGEARAETRQECADAYEKTQTLRDAGKLGEARKNALACTAPACAAFMVKECTAWLSQIDASMPTVVFEVRDATGAETPLARVSLDGQPWLQELDGEAKAIDPGPHTLRISIEGADPQEQTVQIREGEKNRRLTVSFQRAAAPGPSAAPPAAPHGHGAPPSGEAAPSRSPGPWIIGGIGLAGLVVGGVLGGLVLHDHAVATDPAQCSTALRMCTTAGADAESQGRALGPATTAALVVGGVGVATGAIWLGVRASSDKKAPPAALGASVGVVRGALGVRLGGRF